jgi:hypothetical protein
MGKIRDGCKKWREVVVQLVQLSVEYGSLGAQSYPGLGK